MTSLLVVFGTMTQYLVLCLPSNPICMELHFAVLELNNAVVVAENDDDDEVPFNRKTNESAAAPHHFQAI